MQIEWIETTSTVAFRTWHVPLIWMLVCHFFNMKSWPNWIQMCARITYSLFESPGDNTGSPHGDLFANGSNRNFLRGSLRLFFVSPLMNATVLMSDIRLALRLQSIFCLFGCLCVCQSNAGPGGCVHVGRRSGIFAVLHEAKICSTCARHISLKIQMQFSSCTM